MDEREAGQLIEKVAGLGKSFDDFKTEVREGLKRIENGFTAEIASSETGLSKRLSGHSERIAKLERWRSWMAGGLAALAVVGFVIGVVGDWVLAVFRHKAP